MSKWDWALLGFFTLAVLGVGFVVSFALFYHLIPEALGAFCLAACVLALWAVSYYIGANK